MALREHRALRTVSLMPIDEALELMKAKMVGDVFLTQYQFTNKLENPENGKLIFDCFRLPERDDAIEISYFTLQSPARKLLLTLEYSVLNFQYDETFRDDEKIAMLEGVIVALKALYEPLFVFFLIQCSFSETLNLRIRPRIQNEIWDR